MRSMVINSEIKLAEVAMSRTVPPLVKTTSIPATTLTGYPALDKLFDLIIGRQRSHIYSAITEIS